MSLAIIATVYLLVNLALLSGLGLNGLTESKAAGAEVMERTFGPVGRTALGLFVAVAALTSINATMIVGARTNYAMARDWPALRFMGGWHATRGTPVAAFLVQGAIALALVGFGALQHDGFEAMVELRRRCSGHSCCWSVSRCSSCARVTAARNARSASRCFR